MAPPTCCAWRRGNLLPNPAKLSHTDLHPFCLPMLTCLSWHSRERVLPPRPYQGHPHPVVLSARALPLSLPHLGLTWTFLPAGLVLPKTMWRCAPCCPPTNLSSALADYFLLDSTRAFFHPTPTPPPPLSFPQCLFPSLKSLPSCCQTPGNGLFPLGALVLFQMIGLLFSLDAVPGVGLNRVPEVRRVFSFQKS